MHYAFDFAQQIHFLFDSQQTGPAYFKTAHKCGIFGVTCEGKSQKFKYLIDEAGNPGNRANRTISLFHHYLEKYGCGEKTINFMQTTALGKIKTMLAYSIYSGE